MLLLRLFLTSVLFVGAVAGAWFILTNYFEAPWTRDARVRADVVTIAAYNAGKVAELHVTDNQDVNAGDVLLVIDQGTYKTALAQAEATVKSTEANYRMRRLTADRIDQLWKSRSGAVSAEQRDEADLTADSAFADFEEAKARRDSAQLDLERTVIRAPVDGHVTNLSLRLGDFAQPGEPLLALIDRTSFRLEAYFMETQLPRIQVGANARIQFMSGRVLVQGRVTGISRGIVDTQNPPGTSLLLAPQPSFEWVRLAQRVPVQIAFEDVPKNFPLVSGLTATVILDEEEAPASSKAQETVGP